MYWFILFLAGFLEAGWLVGIQKSESFTNIPYVIFAVLSMTVSLVLFSIALKESSLSFSRESWNTQDYLSPSSYLQQANNRMQSLFNLSS